MKKVLLSTALILAASGLFAQNKLVNKANSELKSEKPDFAAARQTIKEALSNEESKDNAKTWYVAGLIEYKAYEQEVNLQLLQKNPNKDVMYPALMDCYKYWLKAAELDILPNEKGKIKPKYVKDIKKDFKQNQNSFVQGAAYYYEDKKDYKNAHDYFAVFTEMPKLAMFENETDEKLKFNLDTTYYQMQYYAALSAQFIPDTTLAITEYNKLKGCNISTIEVDAYRNLTFLYQGKKDTLMYSAILAEGIQKFPSEAFFIESLINLYIGKGEYENAVKYLDEAIKQAPTNAQLYNVKGTLLEEMKRPDDALVLFEKAAEVKPDYAEAYSNMGRIYYNKALEESDKASEIRNNKQYEAAIQEKVNPLYKKALPYFEKAHSLNPAESQYKVILRGIYYKLGMEAEYAQIEKEMNS